MTVWACSSQDVSGRTLLAIYATLDAAEAWREEKQELWGLRWTAVVEPWEVL